MKFARIFTLRNLLVLMVVLLITNLVVLLVRAPKNPKPVYGEPPVQAVSEGTIPADISPSEQAGVSTLSSSELQNALNKDGVLILSMQDGDFFHLFAFHPLHLPFTRLTGGEWDDCYPAVSPDGTRLAFSSHRDGYWDIYILDFKNGSTKRLTSTPAYDSRPAWSPDGKWIAFESLVNDNLEIMLQSADDSSQPVLQLTTDAAADYSAAWSPSGREIAFVSTRSGSEDIWMASLDDVNNRFTNLTDSPDQQENNPAWSPDGMYLAWANFDGQVTALWTDDFVNLPRRIGEGTLAAWNPEGDQLAAVLSTPNHTYLSVYSVQDIQLTSPSSLVWGEIRGLGWAKGEMLAFITNPENGFTVSEKPVLWQTEVESTETPPEGRYSLVKIENVEAHYALLHDLADESFTALNQATSRAAGWDFLSSLENAYTPLTQPVSPGIQQDWLTTGRGIALNPVSLYADWMAVVREEYYGSTYWRVFIKARYQDGSQGAPITQPVWDFQARYNGTSRGYEAGGECVCPPLGYWIDFTALANSYGWYRLPAEGNWRTYFAGTRFNQFAFMDNLTWYEAMIQLYPPEALDASGFEPYIFTTPQP